MVEVVAAVEFICTMGEEPGEVLKGLGLGFSGKG